MRVFPVVFQGSLAQILATWIHNLSQDSEPNLVILPRSDDRRMPLHIALFTWQEFLSKSESSPPVSVLTSNLEEPLFWLARIHLSLCSCPETCCHTFARLRPSNVRKQCGQYIGQDLPSVFLLRISKPWCLKGHHDPPKNFQEKDNNNAL